MKLVLGMEVGLSPGDFVLDEDPVPFPQKGAEPPSPIFGPFLLWPNCSMHQNATWMDVGLSPGDFVLDGDPVVPPQQRGRSPSQFSAHFCCAQTAGCIKMPLGMEVGLSPGEFVLNGDPTPSPKGGRAPSPILRVRELDRKCGALPVVASVVALGQQIILLKTRSESV